MKYSKYLIGTAIFIMILMLSQTIAGQAKINEEVDQLMNTNLHPATSMPSEELDPIIAYSPFELEEQTSEDTPVFVNNMTTNSTENKAESSTKNQVQLKNENKAPANSKVQDLPKHIVKKGESLFLISRQYNISVNKLKEVNNLNSDEILVGQVLYLPQESTVATSQTNSRGTARNSYTEDDLYWLAKIIHAEARGESYEGQVAVGAVVLNRKNSPKFPNTVYGVIFEKWDGKYYQFSPVLDGTINLEPNDSARKAARDAINGVDPSGGALYFYNPATSTNKWIYNLPIIKRIGKHVFAK